MTYPLSSFLPALSPTLGLGLALGLAACTPASKEIEQASSTHTAEDVHVSDVEDIGLSSSLRLVNTVPAFDQAARESEALEGAERLAAFRAEMDRVIPGFYRADRVDALGIDFDQFTLKALDAWPEKRNGALDVAQGFEDGFRPILARFEAQIGPIESDAPVYVVHSLGEFDGATRWFDDQTHLLFGADMIDFLYPGLSTDALLTHELFHLFHGTYFDNCGEIWCSLWVEGLAVHVAETLNPGADDAELGLTLPAPQRPAVEGDPQTAYCSVAELAGSREAEDYRALFSGGSPDGTMPPRYGYFVGYRVAQEIAASHDLAWLAHADVNAMRPLVATTLERMCADARD